MISLFFQEYLTLDDKMIRLFMKDGRKKDIFTPAEPVSRLIFAAHMNLYVGWTPETSKLVVCLFFTLLCASCVCNLFYLGPFILTNTSFGARFT